MSRIAVVTGASAGIGAATASVLKSAGFDLVLGARREDRLRQVGEPLGARWAPLDVTDAASVRRFAEFAGPVDVVVNNAGMGLGMDRVADAVDERWQAMYDTNVLGAMRVHRAFLPTLVERGGHLVVVGSTSGFEVYPGGAGYTASKHALRAMTKTLRLELLGTPVRVTEISPGLVEPEFATVRHAGDAARAKAVYRGMTPLTAADVAACVAFAVSLPAHVNVDEIVVRPVDQASSTAVHRRD
jgi:NADP-dependent 3-hydroxy acid dehydrogenase YdfG